MQTDVDQNKMEICLRVQVAPDRREEVIAILVSVVGPTEGQPGCLGCRILQNQEDTEQITFTEEWASEAQLKRHVQSDLFRRILTVMDLSSREPQFSLVTISKQLGLETIRKWRENA